MSDTGRGPTWSLQGEAYDHHPYDMGVPSAIFREYSVHIMETQSHGCWQKTVNSIEYLQLERNLLT